MGNRMHDTQAWDGQSRRGRQCITRAPELGYDKDRDNPDSGPVAEGMQRELQTSLQPLMPRTGVRRSTRIIDHPHVGLRETFESNSDICNHGQAPCTSGEAGSCARRCVAERVSVR